MTQRLLATAARGAAFASVIGSLALAQGTEAPPVVVHNGPYTAECTGQITPVPVTSAGSFDPDGTSLTYLWFEECPYAFFDDPTAANCNFLIDLELNCTQTCLFELRVFSGGQLVKGFTQATVQDTLAPLITIPADVVAIWVDPVAQTDPLNSGFATAVDCDPNPVIAYTDVAVANTMAGEPELVVTRTWTADDNCLHQSSGVQTITLLSPSGGMGGLLDIAPGSCPNEISASATGVVSLVLFGSNQFDVSQIDRTTLELRRADNLGATVRRAMTKVLDKGRPGAQPNQHCSSPWQDGRLDMQLTFSLAQIQEALSLTTETANAQVEFAVTGRFLDGRWFVLRDTAVVVQ